MRARVESVHCLVLTAEVALDLVGNDAQIPESLRARRGGARQPPSARAPSLSGVGARPTATSVPQLEILLVAAMGMSVRAMSRLLAVRTGVARSIFVRG